MQDTDKQAVVNTLTQILKDVTDDKIDSIIIEMEAATRESTFDIPNPKTKTYEFTGKRTYTITTLEKKTGGDTP